MAKVYQDSRYSLLDVDCEFYLQLARFKVQTYVAYAPLLLGAHSLAWLEDQHSPLDPFYFPLTPQILHTHIAITIILQKG